MWQSILFSLYYLRYAVPLSFHSTRTKRLAELTPWGWTATNTTCDLVQFTIACRCDLVQQQDLNRIAHTNISSCSAHTYMLLPVTTIDLVAFMQLAACTSDSWPSKGRFDPRATLSEHTLVRCIPMLQYVVVPLDRLWKIAPTMVLHWNWTKTSLSC